MERIEDLLLYWKYHPYDFVVDVLGAKPLEYLKENPAAKVVSTQQKTTLDDIGRLVFAKKCLELNKLTEEEIAELAEIAQLPDMDKDKVHTYMKKTGVSIKSGRGPGKTTLLAWLVIWFLVCFD